MLAARAAKEVEARAIVARSNPRNEDGARQLVLKSCKRYSFAKTAMYSKPVGNKDITGLSIRFAEEFSRYWGNLDNSTLLLSEDDERRVFEVACTDLQTNNVFRMPVIVTKTVERKFAKKGDEVVKQRLNSKSEVVYVIMADDDALLTKLVGEWTGRGTIKLRPDSAPERVFCKVTNTWLDDGKTLDQVRAQYGIEAGSTYGGR